jgi:fibro-slime domain-containing protein
MSTNSSSNMNRSMGVAGLLAVVGLAAAGALMSSPERASADAQSTGTAELPMSLTLTGVVRDFKGRDQTGGHSDFEWEPTRGYGHYAGICADALDADGKPVYASTGKKVTTQWRDSAGRNVCPPRPHFGTRTGVTNGAVETQAGGAVSESSKFAQWFRDVPGTNLSKPLSLTLTRTAGSNLYTFNDQSDSVYKSRGGFFPINGELWGNSGGSTPSTNFHFTFELSTMFTYKKGSGQVFTFIGDDDVFVFIDGKCVIDIGGVHSAVSQTVDLDKLPFLEDGKKYPFKFFFAERHRTQSNFRIETTISLENAKLPQTSALFD